MYLVWCRFLWIINAVLLSILYKPKFLLIYNIFMIYIILRRKVIFGNPNLNISHPVMISLMNNENFINLLKGNTCFQGNGFFIDVILTNRRPYFKIYLFHWNWSKWSPSFDLINDEENIWKRREKSSTKISVLIVLSESCCLNFITIMWLLLPLRIILWKC